MRRRAALSPSLSLLLLLLLVAAAAHDADTAPAAAQRRMRIVGADDDATAAAAAAGSHAIGATQNETTTTFAGLQCGNLKPFPPGGADDCVGLSAQFNCTGCNAFGHCGIGHLPTQYNDFGGAGTNHSSVPASVRRDGEWVAFALLTQRELQLDVPYDRMHFLEAHNSHNNRASGAGEADDCPWPPPYPEGCHETTTCEHNCLSIANQEFSFTDVLSLGVRALEIDPWLCFDEMRMAHADIVALDVVDWGCTPWDRPLASGLEEIGAWLDCQDGDGDGDGVFRYNGDILRMYFEDGPHHTGYRNGEAINGPIARYLGDRVYTPAERNATVGDDAWPTMRELRDMGKQVVIATDFAWVHGGFFIQPGYWEEWPINDILPYPNCTFRDGVALPVHNTTVRVYSDATQYKALWSGPEQTGVVLDYLAWHRCGVMLPAADQLNPDMVRTAVFSWADDEPSLYLGDSDTCVMVALTEDALAGAPSSSDPARGEIASDMARWYTVPCESMALPAACRSVAPGDGGTVWTVHGSEAVAGGQAAAAAGCPGAGEEFSFPTNAHDAQQLQDAMLAAAPVASRVWIDFPADNEVLLAAQRWYFKSVGE